MTWIEWAVLSSANVWPDMGLPADHLPRFTASTCEGDPRGEVSLADAEATQAALIARGWLRVGPASDGSDGAWVYPTAEGRAAFEADREAWRERWHADFLRKRRRGLPGHRRVPGDSPRVQ